MNRNKLFNITMSFFVSVFMCIAEASGISNEGLLSEQAGASIRYVDASSTNSVAPYTTKEGATPNLQEAIDVAVDGDIILVAPGTYAPITVEKGITIKGETGNFNDVIIDANSASRCIQVSHTNAVISSLTVTRGHVPTQGDRQGVGIRLSNGGTVTNCHITSCNIKSGPSYSEYTLGGGMYNVNGYVVDCVFDKCSAYNRGAGVGYAQKGDLAIGERLIITNNTINLQHAWGSQTGAAGAWVGGGILRNSIIAHNNMGKKGTYPPPVCATGVRVVKGLLVNCTVYNNHVGDNITEGYAGVVAEASGYVKNCIIYKNSSSKNTTVANWSGPAANFTNCATTPIKELPDGNIDITTTDWTFNSKDPIFQASSHLIDMGADEANCGALDFFGRPRIDNGKLDIGHEEYQTGELSVPFTSSEGYIVNEKISTTLTAYPRGANTDGLIYYWDINGDRIADVIGADKSTIPLEISTPGLHSIYLSVTNSAGYGTTSMQTILIQAMQQFVDNRSKNPVAPYATRETAATDIQDAIDAAIDGGCITIISGSSITPTGPIIIDKDITIKGESGNFNDVFVGTTSAHSLFEIHNPNATISSITISGGEDVTGSVGVNIVDGGVVTNCRVTAAKQSSGKGVGIYNNNGKVLDCVVDGMKMHDNANENLSGYIYYGLAIYQSGDDALTDRCIITNNYSPVLYAGARRGAMVYLDGGSLRNSYIGNNNAGKVQGRTISELATGVLAAGNSIVDNCTIERNLTQGSGIWCAPGLRLVDNAIARNCIAINNGGGENEINDWMGKPTSFINLLTTSSIDGISGGIKANGEVFAIGDKTQLPSLPLASQAINSGAVLDWMLEPSYDLNKKLRIAGNAPDLGCLEAGTTEIAVSYTADIQNGLDSFTATLTPTVSGTLANAPLTFEWDFGDGQQIVKTATLDSITHTFTYPDVPYGEKVVTLTVKAGDNAVDSFSRTFILAPSRVYATKSNPNAQYPYATPETAASGIQTAIDAAYEGSEVIILPNTYTYNSGSATIKVYRNITLRGATGDFRDVVIDVNYKCRAMLITAKNALIRDITISKGTGSNNIQSSGGAGVRMQGSELRNCRITNNSSSDGVFATGVWCDNGKVINCLFDYNYNRGGHMSGLGVQAMGLSALVDGCVFTNNNSGGFYSWSQFRVGVITALDATVRNCYIAHNNFGHASAVSSGYVGVGIFAEGAIIENCTVVSNRFTAQNDEYPNASAGVCGHSGAVFINNLIEDNYSPSGLNNYRFNSTVAITNCATTPSESLNGVDIVSALDGDYIAIPGERLILPDTSSLIGSGHNMPWMEKAVDVYGGKRKVRRNVDIGCIENQRRPETFFIIR